MKTDPKEINNQGVAYFLNHNFAEAKNKYMEALSLDPDNTTALNNLGLLYLHEKKNKEAEALFRKAFTVSENETYALNLGHSLTNQNQFEEAEKYYLKSIEIKKNNLQSWESLVSLYEYTGQFQKATDTLQTIILTLNHHVSYKIKLSKLLIKTGKYNEALDLLHNSLDEKGTESEVLYYIAFTHFKNQNLGLAKTAVESSLRYNPFRELSLELGATIALSLSDNETAIKYWNKILEIKPMNHIIRINKSLLLISKKELEQAVNELEYVLNFDSKNSKALYYKALLYLEEKNTSSEGEKILTDLTQSENDYADMAFQMINSLIKKKDHVD
ncbi:lipopolysaccharide assembly protein LapB [Flavobacterium sp. B183]|uniref:tetratricopeptide repeat protein n=1 Tax=Flavobacterium sp. B183 TaxID=907046 RepID=UPI00201F5FBA|nr:tetratricopeptide repeat protein [Flavobacterium sp. B183]URC14613.1 tetratricopeptide repeat protein [Flavobacterium sp. B183]